MAVERAVIREVWPEVSDASNVRRVCHGKPITAASNRKCKCGTCFTNDSALSVWMGVGKATLSYFPSKSVYV